MIQPKANRSTVDSAQSLDTNYNQMRRSKKSTDGGEVGKKEKKKERKTGGERGVLIKNRRKSEEVKQEKTGRLERRLKVFRSLRFRPGDVLLWEVGLLLASHA
jgi:hypothetical protein